MKLLRVFFTYFLYVYFIKNDLYFYLIIQLDIFCQCLKKLISLSFYICYVVKAKQMIKDLFNIFIVFWGLWVACHVIASVEETFVALDLSRPFREAGGLLLFVIGTPLWAAVMSLLMIMQPWFKNQKLKTAWSSFGFFLHIFYTL